jgi:hypothetical protein
MMAFSRSFPKINDPPNGPKNVFAKPWNRSDTILAIENYTFHVHKSILTMQSPVFEAMLNGYFKEAGQGRITLENKTYTPMVELLKLFYPPNMIEGEKVVICDENVIPILELADEFQAVNVIKQCIDDLINSERVTPQNVLRILPYAFRYYESAIPTLTEVVNRSVSATRLKEFHSKMTDGKDVDKSVDMVWGKFFHLEKVAGKSYEVIASLFDHFVRQIRPEIFRPTPHVINRCEGCGRQIDPKFSSGSFDQIKRCKICLERCKNRFHLSIPHVIREMLWELLLQGGDISTASKEQSQ